MLPDQPEADEAGERRVLYLSAHLARLVRNVTVRKRWGRFRSLRNVTFQPSPRST